MAMFIKEECVSCGACEPECPNEAIAQGDPVYVVDIAKCTECVGHHDKPKCVEVCPVDDCIVIDPNHKETKDQLQKKYEALKG